MLRVCIVGTGYVGLVTGACFSEIGHRVTCVDMNAAKIRRLRRGEIPIYEPGLEGLVRSNVERGRLAFTSSIREAVNDPPHVVFIAVGTPTHSDTGGADLSYVYGAARDAAAAIAEQGGAKDGRFTVFVTKSTVPVGTSREIAAIAGRSLPAHAYTVASNPEFLREGNAIADFMEPDRIVIGSHSERARKVLEELYMPLTRKGRPLVVTSTVETAELIKYAANAFLATKVTFINELARLCERVGADVKELALGVGLDHRIGPNFMNAGPGYGGSCFPKDTRALVKTANDFDSPVEIIEAVIRANDRHKQLMVRKIMAAVDHDLKGKTIAILGLAFKADTDDMREAPAMTIVPQLVAEGAIVRAYDPIVGGGAGRPLDAIAYCGSMAEAVDGADAAVILTEWSEFRSADWAALAPRMKRALVIDLRNLHEPSAMARLGVKHVPLGRVNGHAARAVDL